MPYKETKQKKRNMSIKIFIYLRNKFHFAEIYQSVNYTGLVQSDWTLKGFI